MQTETIFAAEPNNCGMYCACCCCRCCCCSVSSPSLVLARRYFHSHNVSHTRIAAIGILNLCIFCWYGCLAVRLRLRGSVSSFVAVANDMQFLWTGRRIVFFFCFSSLSKPDSIFIFISHSISFVAQALWFLVAGQTMNQSEVDKMWNNWSIWNDKNAEYYYGDEWRMCERKRTNRCADWKVKWKYYTYYLHKFLAFVWYQHMHARTATS